MKHDEARIIQKSKEKILHEHMKEMGNTPLMECLPIVQVQQFSH
jgi:hypothetical protein